MFFKNPHIEVNNNRGYRVTRGLYWKYVDLNTKSKRSAISASAVCKARITLQLSLCGLYSTSIGTSRVNSDLTLKDTMILLSCIFSHVFARLGITELACLLSFLGFDSCVIVNFRKRRYPPIENQITVLSQLVKVQKKSLHFTVEQSTSLVREK